MFDIGPDALKVLAKAHGVTGRLVASVNGSTFTYPVKMESGNVDVNSRQPIRRKLSATIKARLDDPEADIFRTEMRAEYGIYVTADTVQWIPVGVFVVTDANELGGGKLSIAGEDRWKRIVNARFLKPRITSGSTVAAITALLVDADPRIIVEDRTGSTDTHRSALWERDRDKAIITLAQSIGAIVYFDGEGTAIIDYEPDLSTGKVAFTVGGGDGGMLIDAQRGTTQGNTYNAVVVEAERPDGTTALRATATISDPDSRIMFGGSFAQRPRFFRSTLIRTQLQAQTVANSLLRKVSGISKSLDLVTFPHPGLDGGDILLAEVTEGVWERHIVDSFSVELGPAEFSVTTRTPYDPDEEGGD